MMALDLSFASVMSFVTVFALLIFYSIWDIRFREVKNEYIVEGCIMGSFILILTNHFLTDIVLHATALILVIPMVYILFKIGSIGGADAKVLFVVSLISPGIELRIPSIPVLEAIIGIGGEMVVMLLGGYLYWRLIIPNRLMLIRFCSPRIF